MELGSYGLSFSSGPLRGKRLVTPRLKLKIIREKQKDFHEFYHHCAHVSCLYFLLIGIILLTTLAHNNRCIN